MWYAIVSSFLWHLTYRKCYRSIADEDGPKVTDSFYKHLFRGVSGSTFAQSHPDTRNAALALHLTVSKLRADKNCTFRRWVPFIHMGIWICSEGCIVEASRFVDSFAPLNSIIIWRGVVRPATLGRTLEGVLSFRLYSLLKTELLRIVTNDVDIFFTYLFRIPYELVVDTWKISNSYILWHSLSLGTWIGIRSPSIYST
jgi:hypothetical protein